MRKQREKQLLFFDALQCFSTVKQAVIVLAVKGGGIKQILIFPTGGKSQKQPVILPFQPRENFFDGQVLFTDDTFQSPCTPLCF